MPSRRNHRKRSNRPQKRNRFLAFENLEARKLLAAGNGLLAQYFNSIEMTNPALVRIDPTIDFDWGTGSPDGSIGNDGFSVRWSGEVEARFTEEHSFIVNANDGARLRVNGQLLIDGLESGPLSDETATIEFIAGRRYSIELEYVENSGNASVALEWSSSSLSREVVPVSNFIASDRGSITTEIWNGINGTDVSDLTSNANFPASPDSATSLTSLESTTNSGDNFGQRIRGYIHAPTTGPYTFYIAGDESAELWLSNSATETGKALIATVDAATGNRDWLASATQESGPVYLTAGQKYYVEVLHKESSGSDHVSVGWIQPGTDTIEVIEGQHLSPLRATVKVFSDQPQVAEDSLSPAKFTVTRTGPTTNSLDVYFETSGDAVEGTDFAATPEFITIPAGQSSTTLELTPLADSLVEGSESMTVELIAGSGYDVGFKSQRTAYGMLQDDVSAPAGGNSLWSGQALSDFTRFGGTFTTETDSTFGSVIQADIPGQLTNPWNAQLRQDIEGPVTEGDILWVEFRARSVGTDGEISAIFEKTSSPFTKSLLQGIGLTDEWTKIQIPFIAVETYAAGEASFGFHLGHRQQILQFTDFNVLNYGPPQSLSPETSFTLNNLNGGVWGSSQYVPVSGEPFDTAFQVEVTTAPSQAWHIQALDRNEGVVANGDTMRFEFSIRSIQGTNPEATFAVQRTDTYATLFSQGLSLDGSWQPFSFDIDVTEDFGAAGLQAVFNVGQKLQTIEIGGFHWSNLSNTLDIEDLPSRFPSATYGGRGATDSWRSDADQRIETERQAPVTVTVNDVNGDPVDGALVSIRQSRHEFLFGSAINGFDGRLDPNANATGLKYQSEIKRLFNHVVIENSLKWPSWLQDPQRGRDAVDFAISNELSIRGHNIIWPSRQFMPDSIWNEYDNRVANDGTTSADAWLKTTIEARFDEVLNEFDGQIPEWDVVNELYSNHDVMDILGDDIVLEWFQRVRDFDPSIRLTLNDFGIFSGNGSNTNHRDNFDDWLGLLRDDGLLDVIGEQSHYSDANLTDISVFASLVNDYNTEFNAPIAITEFDVDSKNQQLQADYLRDYMTMAFSQPAINQFLHWGFWQSAHWIPDAALYNSDFSIKPNGQAYEDLVFGEWWSDLQGTTRGGTLSVDVFRGEHDVVVEYAGQTYAATVTVDDSGNSSVTIDLPVEQTNYAPVLDSDNTVVAGNAAATITNSGTWFEPDHQTLSLSASHGSVTLNADGTWDWSFDPGQTYFAETVTITGLDAEGGTSQTSFAMSAIDFSVNGVEAQHSTVDSVVLTFNGSVDIDSDAFSVVQRSDGEGNPTGISVASSFTCTKNGDTIVTLEFDGSTRNNFGALEDGNYELTIDGSKVRSADTGITLGADFVYGDTPDEPFFAFYGDNNGDRNVNIFDLLGFRQAYRASTGDANFNSDFDYGGDGIINVFDLLQFRQNYRETLPFV